MIYINGYEIKPTIFPDKTSQVWQLPNTLLNALKEDSFLLNRTTIRWEFESESELIHLAQLKTLLDKEEIHSILYIPTLPYARQDKDVRNDMTFALKSFGTLLNSLKFERVISYDVHNPKKTEYYINNFYNTMPDRSIKYLFETLEADVICYPDAGAWSRYNIEDVNYVTGHKKRDLETGYIEGYEFNGDVEGKHVLIVDDLCDGGMTFIKCTEKLLQGEAKKVDLYVSHGVFSKGTQVLFDAGINRIFTKDGEV